MRNFRYLKDVTTIDLDRDKCIGCKICTEVCPHEVFEVNEKKASFRDKNGCMECGACAKNCPVQAINVNPGVGCASLIINRWLKGKNIAAGGCC